MIHHRPARCMETFTGAMEGKFLLYSTELPRWYTMTLEVISVNMGKVCPSVKVAQLGALKIGMTKPAAIYLPPDISFVNQ